VQRLAFEPLHRDEVLVLRGEAVRDVPHDSRMRELGEHRSLTREACRIPLANPGQHLQRDDATRRQILCPIHRPHTTSAGDRIDPEPVRDDLSGAHSSTSVPKLAV
jgi:hypothetical protein